MLTLLLRADNTQGYMCNRFGFLHVQVFTYKESMASSQRAIVLGCCVRSTTREKSVSLEEKETDYLREIH